MHYTHDKSPLISSSGRIQVKPWFVGLAVAWSSCILLSLGWNVHHERLEVLEQARSALRASFFKDIAFRRWGAGHGGVYVPVTDSAQPDPFMDYLPERDVITPSKRVLTLINPALMVKQFYRMEAMKGASVQGHISALTPLNPENLPDRWEARALDSFQGGSKEVSEVTEMDGQPFLRLMRPVTMDATCLPCHAQQGYELGDLGGGVSVSVSLAQLERVANEQVLNMAVAHGSLWVVGLLGLGLGSRQLSRRVLEREQAESALLEAEERSRIIRSSAMDAIVNIDDHGRICDWSGQADRIFGWSREEAVGQSMAALIIPERYREAHHRGMQTFRQTGASKSSKIRIEINAIHRDGHEIPVELSVSAVTLSGKHHFSAFLRDISERRLSEERIQRDYHAQRVIASVLEISLSAIPLDEKLQHTLELVLSVPWLDLRTRGCIFLADNRDRMLTMQAERGLPEDVLSAIEREEYGRCLYGRVAASSKPEFIDHRDETQKTDCGGPLASSHYRIPIRFGDETTGVMHLYVAHSHIHGPDEERFLSAVSHSLAGMIKRHQAEKELQRSAFFDLLTGLPNRALFAERLERSIQRLQREPNLQSAVLFMDLDRFKNVNDSLGHLAGDRLLIEVARRLERCIRPGDTVARLGGDEFTILLESIDNDADASSVAVRIHTELANPIRIDGHDLYASISVGIALSMRDYSTAQDLLRDADTAMYQAKALGAGKTEIFDHSMHTHAVRVLKMETDLRLAVENDQIHAHYQPIIHVPSKLVVGFEALARWRHPQHGNVPPGEFIRTAEASGLIDVVTKRVLTRACRQMNAWLTQFPERTDLYVSVNFSAPQLIRSELMEQIDDTLARYNLKPQNLRVEVTESILMQNVDLSSAALNRFSEHGIKLHLDDFGTGYSSLSYIHRFPFQTLKVDRSFVSELAVSDRAVGLVRAIIAVAENFGMEVIAEGVETPKQLKVLRQLGCNLAQGYLLSRPMPGEQAGLWLAAEEAAKNAKGVD